MASFILFLTFLLVLVFASVQAIPGGWTKVDVNSDEVKAEVAFAIQTKYPTVLVTDYVTIAAFKQVIKFRVGNFVLNKIDQVVAGMKYDLTVEVREIPKCTVNRFQVWDRFGAKTLAESEVLQDKCSVL